MLARFISNKSEYIKPKIINIYIWFNTIMTKLTEYEQYHPMNYYFMHNIHNNNKMNYNKNKLKSN